jgi:hypothetical protein
MSSFQKKPGSDNGLPLPQKVRLARSSLKLSSVFGAITLATSLVINSNMDTGEYFDLHKYVPQAVERSLEFRPMENRIDLNDEWTKAADKQENLIRYATGVFTLANAGLIFFWYNRKKKWEGELAKTAPGPKEDYKM